MLELRLPSISFLRHRRYAGKGCFGYRVAYHAPVARGALASGHALAHHTAHEPRASVTDETLQEVRPVPTHPPGQPRR